MDMTEKVEAFGRAHNMVVLGRIPFDPIFTRAMIEGKNVLEYAPDSPVAASIKEVWKKIITFPSMNAMGIKDFSAIIQ
jgi:MinD-like ATPase involved in chromosome partitioning or flagellar assembly